MSDILEKAEAAIKKAEKATLTAHTVEERLAVLELAFNAQAHALQALAEALRDALLGRAP